VHEETQKIDCLQYSLYHSLLHSLFNYIVGRVVRATSIIHDCLLYSRLELVKVHTLIVVEKRHSNFFFSFVSIQNVRTCKKTLPGPVKDVLQQPSPPKKQLHKRPLGEVPSVTPCSMATTEWLSTMTVSPSCKTRYRMVPPAFKKATLLSVPVIFCRKQPKPAQQHVVGEISKSQPMFCVIVVVVVVLCVVAYVHGVY